MSSPPVCSSDFVSMAISVTTVSTNDSFRDCFLQEMVCVVFGQVSLGKSRSRFWGRCSSYNCLLVPSAELNSFIDSSKHRDGPLCVLCFPTAAWPGAEKQ